MGLRMKKIFAGMRAAAVASCVAGAVFSASAQVAIELNFVDARIDAVASSVGAMVGKNVVVDPKIKGVMTLVSDSPVSPAVALAQLQAALRMHGYAMVDAGAVLKVVPEAEAKSHASKVNAPAVGAEVQTRVFKLQHENATQVLNVVKPLVSPNNVVNVNPGSNALVVTDYADNIARIGKLLASLDQPSTADLEIIPLEHAIASEMVPLLQQLVNSGNTPAGGNRSLSEPALDSTLMADSRSNSLIVRAANPAKLQQIRSLAARLDQPAIQNETSAGNIHVVYLKHADAVSLAETLRAAIRTLEQTAPAANPQGAAQTSNAAGTAAGASNQRVGMALNNSDSSSGGLGNQSALALGQMQMPSVGGLVQADPNTNSLIITAPAPLYRQLRTVIDKLDSRRAQVLVESLIVEVNDDKLAEFGVQWQAAVGNNGGTLGAIGTNSSLNGANLLNITAAIASGDAATQASALGSLGQGMNLAIAPKAFGQYYLGALVNFLQNDKTINILSKPNLLTLDNQEARIIIGENVPFVTGSYANTGGNSGAVNPFTTVERKDVGVMLRIRPTINENGTIRLTVNQESSAVKESTRADPNGLTTTKRSIESTIVVDDGSMVMLGGLMEDTYGTAQDKVPVLGDIPVVGNLFRSENRVGSKTNMMVFLRPVVLRDGQSADDFANERYSAIRGIQQSVQPRESWLLGNVNQAPVLPQLDGLKDSPSVAAPVQPQPTVQPQHRTVHEPLYAPQ